MNDLLIMILYGLVLVFFSYASVIALLRGFFITYIRARTSFGKYLIVKVRNVVRDYIVLGSIEGDFLTYTYDKQKNSICLDSSEKQIYRFLGVNWVDIDEAKGAICSVDYSAVTGFDAQKYSNLYTRALMRPALRSNQDKIVLFLLVIICVLLLANLYLNFNDYEFNRQIMQNVGNYVASIKATVIGGTNAI